MEELTLFTYCRSSAAYRVRIALNVKGINYQSEFIHLLKDGGQEKTEYYSQINPQQLIPSLLADGDVITQSMAIIEYIDEVYPIPALLPDNPIDRSYVRSIAQTIACDIHPLNNLRVLEYLEKKLSVETAEKNKWYCHWINLGFSALEERLKKSGKSGKYCFENQITMADICLVPQVYNALRFNCDPKKYTLIYNIYQNCMKSAVFINASPEKQKDFVVS
ncbi:MAG: maleylacetoacetate isomerase [Gammaproteobacteria bacterium]|nr:maleylacetoacetate isomerase [Gammaproteobacteria bacterium]